MPLSPLLVHFISVLYRSVVPADCKDSMVGGRGGGILWWGKEGRKCAAVGEREVSLEEQTYTEALSKWAGVETPCLYWKYTIQEISGSSSLLADRISCRHSSTTRLLRIGLAIPVKHFFFI